LVEHGRVGDDPTLALIEYAADPGTRVDDREAWKQANPALAAHSQSAGSEPSRTPD
jgi:hypothetical protein